MLTILQSIAKRENIGRTIRAPGLFEGLPKDVRELLKHSGRSKKYGDGQLVQHRGDDPDCFFVIAKGQVKLGQYDKNGDMRVLLMLGADDSFGEMSCLGGFPRAVDAEAVGETELILISETQFTKVLLDSSELCLEVARVLTQQLREAMDHLVIHRKSPAPQRLSRTLVMLCDDRTAPITLSIRHQELAELVGVSRVSIAKTLSALDEKGILKRGYGEIIIHDVDALKSWVK